MRKLFVTVCVLLFTAELMAGGNINSDLSGVAKIPNKICKENKLYIEQDVRLMWQDQAFEDAEDAAFKRNHSVGKAGSWNHAKNYCRNLSYGGFADWRLPTSDELVHVHRKEGQSFTYHRGDDFWSSTPSNDSKYNVVFPADAYSYKRYKKESNYVRCVRCMGAEVQYKKYFLSSNPKYITR